MKARRIIIKNERAISPVIGVIISVTITIIITSIIAASILGFGYTNSGPMTKFTATDHVDDLNINNTGNNNLVLLHHINGDSLNLSEIIIQIKGPGDLSFIRCNTTQGSNDVYYANLSGQMIVGDTRIITTDTKNSSNTGTYNVQIIHSTTSTFLLDKNIPVV
jgi:FlaG/FlaF family flagellin (archaellin)